MEPRHGSAAHQENYVFGRLDFRIPDEQAWWHMVIRSSSQVSRWKLLRRFPVPKRYGVPKDSRIVQGRHWPAPAGAKLVVSHLLCFAICVAGVLATFSVMFAR